MKRVSLMLATFALTGTAIAADVTYRNDIQPLFKAMCYECHGDTAPSSPEFQLDKEKFKKEKLGPKVDTYSDLLALVGWPETGALMRRLDDGSQTADKKPGNMHKYLGETDAERAKNLQLVKAWVGEGAWNLKRWKARGETPAVTKEELDLLKLKY